MVKHYKQWKHNFLGCKWQPTVHDISTHAPSYIKSWKKHWLGLWKAPKEDGKLTESSHAGTFFWQSRSSIDLKLVAGHCDDAIYKSMEAFKNTFSSLFDMWSFSFSGECIFETIVSLQKSLHINVDQTPVWNFIAIQLFGVEINVPKYTQPM